MNKVEFRGTPENPVYEGFITRKVAHGRALLEWQGDAGIYVLGPQLVAYHRHHYVVGPAIRGRVDPPSVRPAGPTSVDFHHSFFVKEVIFSRILRSSIQSALIWAVNQDADDVLVGGGDPRRGQHQMPHVVDNGHGFLLHADGRSLLHDGVRMSTVSNFGISGVPTDMIGFGPIASQIHYDTLLTSLPVYTTLLSVLSGAPLYVSDIR